uniref:Sugar transporter SWEET1 n=1 Tax=Skeletonema marinoi TaxID=267567 RepID=A0A7S2KF28_9STRA
MQSLLTLCGTLAPYCGVLCFLAPMPTILEVARDKSTGALPLLPYSSMISNSFVWVMYGLLKNLPSVYMSNAVGVTLGTYYFRTYTKYCTTIGAGKQIRTHFRGAACIIVFNMCLAQILEKDMAADIIGKEGVFYCMVLFASPLVALKHVLETKSAASIPLPFTLACFVNCLCWSVTGWFTMKDFNIYFPNLMGLSCACAQLGLKGMYGDKRGKGSGLPN